MKFEHDGHQFKMSVEHDSDGPEPWNVCDGHGIVTEWTRRAKAPGEKILTARRDSSKRFYDMKATHEKATRDSWGIGPEEHAKLKEMLGREPTKKEIISRAVDLDFEHLRAWAYDEWWYVGVVVTLLKEDADAPDGYFETRYKHSLWCIESDAGAYLQEVARELAAECIAEKGQVA